ncbi:protein saf1-like [Teratosphaeria destructans]|uniref:Protein saf1-like n=1 Tax=Teratosphaeria destructans TaxID=418781 RepID=A0A9W7W888_9PEZI|nr:protein saf1-like [Teratosphaeria destructans]
MPKERGINPAQAQRKADKQKEIAKSRKQQQAQRNEKLARRNPERLQRQVDELKELESRGVLRPKDKETLAQLEKDLRGVRRAREALGDAAPKFAERRHNPRQEQQDRRQQQNSLGKRRRDEENAGSDTDPEVRSIPMPRDTPPPFPRQPREVFTDPQVGPDGKRMPHALPSKPAPAAQITYSSAPQIRDLKKEAVKFMPAVVSQQRNRVRGQGRLLEPEELDKLEQSGYAAAAKAAEEADKEAKHEQILHAGRAQQESVDLEDELRRFESEIAEIYPSQTGSSRAVLMEEVDDEGD